MTFHEAKLARRIVREARRLNADIPIIVRTRDDHHMEELENAGADMVVPETLESSLNVATRTLEQLKVDKDEILRLVEKARGSHYRRLRGVFHGVESDEFEDYIEERLHTVVLSENDHAIGLTLNDLNLEEFNVEVEALQRHGVRGELPDASIRLLRGDAVVLRGLAEDIEDADKRLHRG